MKYAWPESSGGAWDHAYDAALCRDKFWISGLEEEEMNE
jgi:hypothetical protein